VCFPFTPSVSFHIPLSVDWASVGVTVVGPGAIFLEMKDFTGGGWCW
jgi:hypothetical protein